MGCANSKLDDLPAVSLCRHRLNFLDDAIRHRYLLAESHIAYLQSLKQVGRSLHNFITDHAAADTAAPPSPRLNLPPAKKAEASGADSVAKAAHHSHSNSGGHIEFRSDPDDDDDESGSESGTGSPHSSPLHDYHQEFEPSGLYMQHPDGNYMRMMMGGADGEMFSGYNPYTNTNTNTHVNYMKNEPKSSIVYQQKPMSPETVQYHHLMGESSSSSSSDPSSYTYSSTSSYPTHSDSSSSSYPYSYPFSSPYSQPSHSDSSSTSYSYFGYPNPTNPPQPPGGGGGGGGYHGLPYGEVGSSSKPPPPPPSPPQASPWEFLNPFESYDKYYPQYTPSRDSKELREAEGIPDLEEVEFGHHEPVKKVHVAEKFVDGGGGGDEGSISSVDSGGDAVESLYQTRPSVDDHEEGVKYDVHVVPVDKKVVDRERSEEQRNAGRPNSRDPADVAREIEVHFAMAAETGGEIVQILEVGKLPHDRKHVASKMLHGVTPALSVVSSQPSSSKSAESSSNEKAGPGIVDIDEDLALRTKKLSSTLHKLHLWEKKLFNEVKAEEKMRVVHDRKVRKLKRMDEKGAEAHKVDATRTIIRSLSTKIRMAIQVVDKIAVMISKIRDEELWPQINELIQGLTRMWRSMLECHRNQCQAIREAKSFGPIGSGKMHDDFHLEAISKLEQELLNWTNRFSSWIGAQKGYVRALNSWLLKCLPDEREETVDGVAPFSPGRIGAPPIFVICNQWSQAMERISEKEVIGSMRVLAVGVFQLWEQDKLEMRRRMVAHKDMERHVRKLDREDQKMQKQIQALDKKMVPVLGDGNGHLVSGHAVYQSDTSSSNLQGSLQHIFEALERFTADSVKAYEELLQRTEEVTQPRGSERIP